MCHITLLVTASERSVNEAHVYLKFAITYVTSFLPAKLISVVLTTHITIILHTLPNSLNSYIVLTVTKSLLP